MSDGVTVGKLRAELGLDDLLTKALGKAESTFKATATRMDAEATITLDDSDLSRARSDFEGETSGLHAEGTIGLDTSELKAGEKEATGSLFDMVGGWATAGPLAAAGVGALIGGALLDAFQGVLERQQSADKLAAQLGLDQKGAAHLGGLAGKIYADNFGDSITDVNEVLKGIAQQDLLPDLASDEQITALTEGVLNFAKAMDQDVGGTVRAVSQMIRTGIARDGADALDILTRGVQVGNDKSEDLLDTFNEYPTQFRELGLSGAQAMGLIRQGLEGGARDSDIVADALKEVAIRGKDMSATTLDGFKRLKLNGAEMTQAFAKGGPAAAKALDQVLDGLRKVKNPAEQAAIATELFGTQSEDAANALLALDPTSAVAALGQVEGAAANAGNTLNDNLGSQIDSITRKLSPESLLSAFDTGGFQGVKDQVSAAVGEIGDLWDQYGPQVTAAFDEAKQQASDWWDQHGPEVTQKVSDWWDQTARPALGTAIGNALSGAWDEGWSAFGNHIKDSITDPGSWDDLLMPGHDFGVGLAKQIANGIVQGFEDFWNDLSIPLPSYTVDGPFGPIKIGGGSLDFPNIDIPSLAGGGLATSPTLAMIGDAGAGNPEIVSPVRQMEEVVARALAQAGGAGFNMGDVNVYGVREPETADVVVRKIRQRAYLGVRT